MHVPSRPTKGSRASFVHMVVCLYGDREAETFTCIHILEGTEVPKVNLQRRQIKMTENDFMRTWFHGEGRGDTSLSKLQLS